MNPLTLFAGPMGLVYKWLVILALITAAMGWSYTKGISRESDRRDALELKQAKIEDQRHAAAVAYGVDQARQHQVWQAAAEDYGIAWKEAKNDAKRKGTVLAVGDCNPAVAGQAANPLQPGNIGPAAAPGAIRLRLTWDFVGMWDSAYTADDGKSFFGDTTRAEKAAAGSGAASPYGPDELLDVHGENAKRFDACRRQLRRLNATIDGLEEAWNKQHR